MEKNNRKKSFIAGLIIGLIGAIAAASIVISAGHMVNSLLKNGSASGSSDIFGSAVKSKISLIQNTINTYYMGDISENNEIDGVYKGIVESLNDPYSEYYTVSELSAVMEEGSGTYSGIGCYISYDEDTRTCKVSSVIPGTPAEKAGIMSNDVFYEVDGQRTTGWTASDVATHVKGEEGTTVDLIMLRDGEQKEFNIQRKKVDNPTVSVNMADKDAGIGYLRITEFDDITSSQFKNGMQTLNDEGMKALILDLRDNPGGNVDTVVDIAGQFLPAGKVMYTVDKNGKEEDYNSDGLHEFNKPLVVLCNGNSASAAEILTGSIKDYKKGTVVGEKTFGKGIVQRIIPFQDGSAIKLTIAKYYLPNGECIHGEGIEPDVEIKLDTEAYEKDGTDNQLKKAIEIIKKEL